MHKRWVTSIPWIVCLVFFQSGLLIADGANARPILKLLSWIGSPRYSSDTSDVVAILAVSGESCMSCSLLSVNGVINTVKSAVPNLDLVIVGVLDASIDNLLAVKGRLSAPVRIDSLGLLKKPFPKLAYPELILMRKDGASFRRFGDVQHAGITVGQVRAALRELAGPLTLDVRLRCEGCNVGAISKAILDVDHHRVVLLSPVSNALFSFDVTSGVLNGRCVVGDSLRFHFRKDPNDREWATLGNMGYNLAQLIDVAPCRGDTLSMLSEFISGYHLEGDTEITNGGEDTLLPSVVWEKRQGIVDYSGGRVVGIRTVESPGYVLASVESMNGGKLSGIAVPLSADQGKDTLGFIFTLLCTSNTMHLSVTRSDIEKAYPGKKVDRRQFGMVKPIDDSTWCYVSPGNRLLFVARNGVGGIDIRRIEAQGLLALAFDSAAVGASYPSVPGSRAAVTMMDMYADASRVYFVVKDSRKSRPAFFVETYSLAGKLLGSVKMVRSGLKDLRLIGAVGGSGCVLGVDTQGLFVKTLGP